MPPAFAALLADFAAFAGVAGATDGALGLEFEAGAHVVRVLPHPADPDWLIAEVDVASGIHATPTAYQALHRVNHAARLEHGWMATFDDEDALVMHVSRPVASVTAADLEGLLVEGLERAEALAAIWRDIAQATGSSASAVAEVTSTVSPFSGFIRG